MKILWVTATPIGPVSDILDLPYHGTSGGWINWAYQSLIKEVSHSDIVFLCGSRSVKKGDVLKKTKNEQTAYALNFPKISFGRMPSKKTMALWKKTIDEIKPDVIHIWGTETITSYLAAMVSNNIPKVLFLQGVIGVHSRYDNGYINALKDDKYYGLIGKLKLFKGKIKQHYFCKQVALEHAIINASKNVITDNEFFKAYCLAVNPTIRFYNNQLPLGEDFVNSEWKYDACKINTIFTVYGGSGNKGLHQLLKAIVLVKRTIPDVQIRIPGGYHAIGVKRLKKTLKMTSFEIWLEKFILQNNLHDNVVFVGRLTSAEMAKELQKCNVFVNPSCMETHASSMREALLTGTPTITSLCGSVIEFVNHDCNGYIYRYEEYEMLAYYINKILSSSNSAIKLGKQARVDLLARLENVATKSFLKTYGAVLNQRGEA